MYAVSSSGWGKAKLVSAAISVALNLAIFASFAWFTNIGSLMMESSSSLAVFQVGEQGEVDGEQSAEPHPPQPSQRKQQPQQPPEEPHMLQLARPEPMKAEPFEPADALVPEISTEQIAQPIREVPKPEPQREEAVPRQEAASASTPRKAASEPSSDEQDDAYGASVYSHLMRFRRGNTVGPGDVTLQFTVLDDGGTQNISIVISSGSSRFDREALQMVRRAAPFPRPPDGTRRTFRFGIRGS